MMCSFLIPIKGLRITRNTEFDTETMAQDYKTLYIYISGTQATARTHPHDDGPDARAERSRGVALGPRLPAEAAKPLSPLA